MIRVRSVDDFYTHHARYRANYEVSEVSVHIGFDPGARNLGIFFLCSNGCYASEVIDVHSISGDKRQLVQSMHDPVACGIHIAALQSTVFGRLLRYLAIIHDVVHTSVTIEVVNEGPSNYWAAAISGFIGALFSTYGSEGMTTSIVGASAVRAKNNVGIECSGHSSNKANSLHFCRTQLGFDLSSDHESDALLLVLLTLPRNLRLRVPGARPGTTRYGEESIDEYTSRIVHSFANTQQWHQLQHGEPPTHHETLWRLSTTSGGTTSTQASAASSDALSRTRTVAPPRAGSTRSLEPTVVALHGPTKMELRKRASPTNSGGGTTSSRATGCINLVRPTAASLLGKRERPQRCPSAPSSHNIDPRSPSCKRRRLPAPEAMD